MNRLALPRPSPLDRAAETAAALLAVALYVVVVSRGELLPYAGPARALTAPLLALGVVGLAGWRLRAPIAAAWRAGHLQRATLALGLLAAAAGLRLLANGLARPAAPIEAAVVADALNIIRNQAPEATDPVGLLLAWLHAPVAAACYVAGVSGGLWEGIKFIEPPVALAWSRGFHLALSLASVGVAGLAAGRRPARAPVGWPPPCSPLARRASPPPAPSIRAPRRLADVAATAGSSPAVGRPPARRRHLAALGAGRRGAPRLRPAPAADAADGRAGATRGGCRVVGAGGAALQPRPADRGPVVACAAVVSASSCWWRWRWLGRRSGSG